MKANDLNLKEEIRNFLASNGDSLDPFDETVELISLIISFDLNKLLSYIEHYNLSKPIRCLADFKGLFPLNPILSDRLQNFANTYDLTFHIDKIYKYKHKDIPISNVSSKKRDARMDYITSRLSNIQYDKFLKMKANNFLKNQKKIVKYMVNYQFSAEEALIIAVFICFFMKETILVIIDKVYQSSDKQNTKGNSSNICLKYEENNHVTEYNIYPYFRYGITINDINDALGHLYTRDEWSSLKNHFPSNPYFIMKTPLLKERDLLVNELLVKQID